MVEQIINALDLLDLKNLDIEVYTFLHSNFNYFIARAQDTIVKDNEFIIVNKDNSMFKVMCTPNVLTPKNVYIELVNMNNEFIQSYAIDYLEKNSVRVTYKMCFNFDYSQSKDTTITYYENNKKTFIKKNQNYIVSNSIMDKNCSREIKRYYYDKDDKYTESIISVGLPNSFFPTSIVYFKSDGTNIKKISQPEFSTLRYRKNAKVLKKVS